MLSTQQSVSTPTTAALVVLLGNRPGARDQEDRGGALEGQLAQEQPKRGERVRRGRLRRRPGRRSRLQGPRWPRPRVRPHEWAAFIAAARTGEFSYPD